MISAYVQQQNRSGKEKDQFYDDLDEELWKARSDNFVVWLRDLNGHLGANLDGFEGVHAGLDTVRQIRMGA